MKIAELILLGASLTILGFYVILQTYYLFLLGASLYGAWSYPRRKRLFTYELLEASPATPPVALLVPAHNEAVTIVESVRALLGLRYPCLELVVINDGSTDDTLGELIRSFSLYRANVIYPPLLTTEKVRGVYVSAHESRLMVVDKVNGGKSDALNAGINLSRSPWICAIDADSLLEEDALLRSMRPAIEDNIVVASCGIVRIANGCRMAAGRVLKVLLPRERLAVFQVVEYLRGFLGGRLGWSWLNSLLIISGAFGVFRTDVLRTIGGYARNTVGEDMDLVVRIHRHFRKARQPYRVVFVPDPVCWTEVPSRLAGLRQQRRRWQRGLAEVLQIHRSICFRPSLGVVGLLAYPYFVMEFLAPPVELVGLVLFPVAWALGAINQELFLVYLLLAFLLGVLFALWAVVIEEFTYRRYNKWSDLLRLILFAVCEHLGYHQLTLWWRLEGVLDYLRGRREWGKQIRTGFRSPIPSKAGS